MQLLRISLADLAVLQESTLKRHGYYCQSKRSGAILARPRACFACKRGKARCDNRHPECSRCVSRAVACLYPPETTNATRTRAQYGGDTRVHTTQVSLPPVLLADFRNDGHSQQTRSNESITLDGGLSPNTEILHPRPDETFNWNESLFSFRDFSNPPIDEQTGMPPPGGSFWVDEPTPPSSQFIFAQQPISSPNPSIPPTPTQSIRLLNHRPRSDASTRRIATLTFHTLKSYPRMMLRDDTLPPFIHSSTMSSSQSEESEPLINCISLVHMISGETQRNRSRKLFWSNVRRECERWCESVRELHCTPN